MPFLRNSIWSVLEICASSVATSPGSISTIVTFVPNALKIEANSQPMTPPPTMRRLAGTRPRSRISLLLRIRLPSNGRKGSATSEEPVATMILFAATAPMPSTSIEAAPVRRPVPLSTSIRRAFRIFSTPETSSFTTRDLFAKSPAGSISTGPPEMPRPFPSRTRSSRCAAPCSAFVGMQPQLRHVPPSDSFSMRQTFAPSCAARIAAGYPAGPPPRTATSNSRATSILPR